MRAMVVVACWLLPCAYARAADFALIIGNNAAPSGASDLTELRYADDDAASFFELVQSLPAHSHLLSILDRPSQRRYPAASDVARAPTLQALRDAVADVRAQVIAANQRGEPTVLWFFFSGHGGLGADGTPYLALADGALTQALLYDEVLAAIPATLAHVFVDACHAEAVVRPRDATQAPTFTVSAKDVEQLLQRSSLARFAHVGAALASQATQVAHEWDEYENGVFTR